MPIIQNVSKKDMLSGNHIDADVYIQIVDFDSEPYLQKQRFKNVFKFAFDDESDESLIGVITDLQAQQIYEILKFNYEHSRNIVVSCIAGLNRSGSIAQCGNMLGYDLTDRTNFSFGNPLVKRKISKLIHGYEEDDV